MYYSWINDNIHAAFQEGDLEKHRWFEMLLGEMQTDWLSLIKEFENLGLFLVEDESDDGTVE